MEIVGRYRIRGDAGAPNRVRVEMDAQVEDWPEADYVLGGHRPALTDLPWARNELPPLPAGAPDDWEAERGDDAILAVTYPPQVSFADGSGTLKIDWRRRLRPRETQRYLKGTSPPAWIDEVETLFGADIRAVAKALAARAPTNEEELQAALDGLAVVRNFLPSDKI